MGPYPKSRALHLHHEEIISESLSGFEQGDQVAFFPFTGVAPRQYPQLFSMSERSAKKGKSLQEWEVQKTSLSPLYVDPNASRAYLAAERQELGKLPVDVFCWDRDKVCP
jgi:hypothetical protein